MVALVLLALILLAGIAAATGHAADTRDTRYGVGPLVTPSTKGGHR